MKKKNDSIYTAIRIEGGLLSTSLLDTLRHYGLPGQTPADYGIEKGLKLADELGRYWRIAQARWEQFNDLRARSDIDKNKLAVEDWLLPLLSRVLYFDIEKTTSPITIGERQFPITHTAFNDVVPLVLAGEDQKQDKGDTRYGQEGRKRSPMGLVQEYLNAEDNCLWAVVCNGLTLRLLRDNPAMTRPAYVEVDLERIFTEELYVDFTVFWLLLHGSRFVPRESTPESCYLEQWREQGQTDGERVLGQLRYGVTDALRLLGTGFVSHPGNKTLRASIQSGELTTDRFFQELLRLIYRFLFLLTTEDRDVLLDPDADLKAKHLYHEGYSISNLRDRARLRRYWDKHDDAWQQLLITFAGFSTGQPLLGQPALGGLFAPNQCATLENTQLANRYLFNALFKLCYFESDHVLVRINYRDMDTEELGSVYESLLELIPQLNVEGQWRFGFMGDEAGEGAVGGHARKLTGSYYTPDTLVQELIESALAPVIQQRLMDNPAEPTQALQAIRVCDPACGSGHFLLAAARRLAAELARIEAGADQPSEADYRHAMRQVVRHCIYGVDLNPLAVELCRTALWLEAIEPGKPLGFLDTHICVGNSVVGVINPELLLRGIPEAAYKPLSDDVNEVAKAIKGRNKINPNQRDLFATHSTDLAACAGGISLMPEESLQQIEEKREAWHDLTNSRTCQDERLRADMFTAAFFAQKIEGSEENVPTNLDMVSLDQGGTISNSMRTLVRELSIQYRFFHWFLAFPEVFECGGFDVVLSNPPWKMTEFSDKTFFGKHDAEISKLVGKGRKVAINNLKETNQTLHSIYMGEKQGPARLSLFVKNSGRYRLCLAKKIDLYSMFAELMGGIRSDEGRIGFVLPTSLLTLQGTAGLVNEWLVNNELSSFYDFENKGEIFKIDRTYRFSLITIGHSDTVSFATWLHNPNQIKQRAIEASNVEFNGLSKGVSPIPMLFTDYDRSIYRKILSSVAVGKEMSSEWHCMPKKGLFNTSSDSNHFIKASEAEMIGQLYPLYEDKNIDQYDHNYSVYNVETEKFEPNRIKLKEFNSRYYVHASEVDRRLHNYEDKCRYLLVWRDITRSAVWRTGIFSLIPKAGVADTLQILFFDKNVIKANDIALLLGNLNSLVFDFCVRRNLANNHLTFFVLDKMPIIGCSSYSDIDKQFILPRVLELIFTSMELKYFAEDVGFCGEPFDFDSERRHQLKCELDAYYARLYRLNRDELRYILDPIDVLGEDYPSETFRVLKKKELKEFGEYRTQRLVLETWDKLETGELS